MEVYIKSFLLETTMNFARKKSCRAEIKLSTEVLRIEGKNFLMLAMASKQAVSGDRT